MSAILFTRNIPIAMLISQVMLNLNVLTNSLIPINTTHYSLGILSELRFMKFTHDFIILNEYGMGRCSPGQVSTVLYAFNIDDNM